MTTAFMPRRAAFLAALFSFALAAGGVLFFLSPARGAEPAPASREEIEKIVEEYLLEHPEILNEMIRRLEAKETAARAEAAVGALKAQRGEIENDGYSIVAGNPNGDVTLVEFFDYNCGFCRKGRPEVEALLQADPNVRLVLKEFPILGDESLEAARVALALAKGQPEKYLEFHKRAFAYEGRLDGAHAIDIAKEVGADMERLTRDAADPVIMDRVERNHRLAGELGIDGTPSFVVGDKVVSGVQSLDELKALVADARAKCETC